MHLVVIGGVAAGMSAASRARRLRPDWCITVLEKGPVVSYGACGLPYWIGGTVANAAELIVHPPEFFERERDIRVRIQTRVAAIAPARRRVILEGGEELPYDRLILATGAQTAKVDFPGPGHPHSFSFRNWDDAHRLDEYLRDGNPRSAAVIGAGFVGLELAEALAARGLRVTVFDQASHFFGWRDEWLSVRIRDALAAGGIGMRLGEPIGGVHASGVDDVPADLVLIVPGIRPSVELCGSAGVVLGRSGAIAVNESLETSVTGIYAAGDCAETYHRVLKAPSWIPLGTTANKMGRVAGANAVGMRERFPGIVGTAIARVCGVAVAVTGLSEVAARGAGFQAAAASVTARQRASYFGEESVDIKLIADRASGRLIGAAAVGETGVEGRINVMATAIGAGMTVEEFQFADLCYAPPYATVWDPLLRAAQQLAKELV